MAAFVAACSVGIVPIASARETQPSPIVKTVQGPVMGVIGPTVSTFLGIPYAAPPVGDLRWWPPQPVVPWTTPLDASQFGNICPQGGNRNEDCLYLNVYVPTKALESPGHHFPVMVWVHGGAFLEGAGSQYEPTRLVTMGDVIVVTINYRLGALGFLAHPALSAESNARASGNYGIMDQQAAFKWVKQNIAAFGGNPGNVTIFGESAGGQSMFSNLVSPLAKGLFRRVIIESGSYGIVLPTLADSEANGTAFANAVGCSNQTVDCLRSVPVDTLLSNQGLLAGITGFTLTPNIDGFVLPQSIDTALADGDFNRVPVIDGTNHDEFRLFVALIFDLGIGPMTADLYPGVLEAYFTSNAPAVLSEYPLSDFPSPDLAFATLITDNVFSCQAVEADMSMAKFTTTYTYEFADENAPSFLPPVSFPLGAAHSFELPYLFDSTVIGGPPPPFTPDQQTLSDAMIANWTNFARDGVPIHGWKRLSKSGKGAFEVLVPPTPVQEPVGTFSADHKCSFWASLPQG